MFYVQNNSKRKNFKTLANAKKCVDKEGGVVMEDGAQVYPVIECTNSAINDSNTITAPSPKSYTVIVKVNVRSEPSLEAKKLGTLEMGMIIQVLEEINDEWLSFKWHNSIAYARHHNHEHIRLIR